MATAPRPTMCQGKASAGESIRANLGANLRGIFGVFVGGLFFLGKKKQEEQIHPKSTAKIKSEFRSFAAKIHAARIWP